MAHSQSSVMCYLGCQKQYELQYIDKCTPEERFMPHLEFGSMAHKVLEEAGKLRDNLEAGIPDYDVCIPSELSYPMLKDYFNISSWSRFFIRVCKRVADYERALIENLNKKTSSGLEIFREKKFTIPSGYEQPHTGVIDLLLLSNDRQYAIIIDYKFSSHVKTQEDFDHNVQLYLYAYFVNKEYGVPLKNIQIGYIDIIKQDSSEPIVLSSGKLSKNKSQNVLYDDYIDKIIELNLDVDEYKDFLNELKLRDVAYISLEPIDDNNYNILVKSYLEAVDDIECKKKDKKPFLRKIDAHSCADCRFKEYCRR